MDRDLWRMKRRREFLEKREKSYNKAIKEFLEGITKENHEQFKKRIKEEESKGESNARNNESI